MTIDTLSKKFAGVKKSGNKFTAICPAHDDKHSSLSFFISDTNPNKIAIKCHAGCEEKVILNKIGLDIKDLYSDEKIDFKKPTIESVYDYTDENGNLLHQTVRYNPKKFLQRRPDGNGGWIWNLQDTRTVIYNLPNILKFKNEHSIFICEGEKDCDNLSKYGFFATTNPGGATKWKPEYNDYFNSARVCIIPDNDDIGLKHAQLIQKQLSTVAYRVTIINLASLKHKLEPKQDISDYINILERIHKDMSEIDRKQEIYSHLMTIYLVEKANQRTKQEVVKQEIVKQEIVKQEIANLEIAEIITVEEPVIKQDNEKLYSTWADLNNLVSDISWSWYQWLPNGLLTILASESGKGKSYIALKIGASFITGEPFPDGTKLKENELGKILWCEAESAEAVNLERAKHWGLPLDKIVTPFPNNPMEQVNLDNAQHRERILKVALLPEIKYIVVDSLSGSNKQDENSSAVATVVKFLAEVAKLTGKPVVLIHHLNKPMQGVENKTITLNRLRGSSAIVQYARVILAIDEPNASDTQHRRLNVIKSNVSTYPKPIGYKIDDDKNLIFTEAPEAVKVKSKVEKSIDLLNSLIKPGNKVLSSVIEEEFERVDISMDSARKAQKELGIEAVKDGKTKLWSWYRSL